MNRPAYYALAAALSAHFNVPMDAILRGESFSLKAPEAALLGSNIQQRSDFLKQINMVQVATLKGNKLFGATEKGVTGRKTNGRNLASLDHTQNSFELAETDSGILIPWALFDSFALFKDRLVELYSEYFQNQVALDILQIGWNGKSVAADTSASDLSDVNKGWLKLLAEQKAKNFMTEAEASSGKITIFGSGSYYANLDELAFDLRQGLDYRHQNRNDLVFLVGADLVSKETKLIQKQHGLTPTEKAVLGSHNLMGSFGGMNAITPPNFPARGAVVTALSNLSVYTQAESVRRSLRSDEDRKGVITSYYRQEGYVVEDLGLMTAIDHTKVKFEGES
ncbi:phage major capsid protein, P2 family [Avibacterium paragallinarum]|uniref:phage major capsid protein, P2 family n=1 Tax=Avibacterium paragallinarum TaxID=728 RepID=UPI000614B04F|nr:phage major capsid protein, P2 family [Avibacterium paragallinarum]KAA6209309.1 phage major capsid protein, P2 family [Avibacterium paragallinarum]KKB01558.1 capsid protein [Avibacterium paragallinarum]RZN72234.1 phage major capsid protein, P2 family [Avibacterium paragallinarum]